MEEVVSSNLTRSAKLNLNKRIDTILARALPCHWRGHWSPGGVQGAISGPIGRRNSSLGHDRCRRAGCFDGVAGSQMVIRRAVKSDRVAIEWLGAARTRPQNDRWSGSVFLDL